ncbi:hypothetical protein BJV82DRAFT_630087 [Fennellomyces sp. T-0311]|nr:hypothetical protein BJV82DRAFT_630087 [Fennellomyces sp. T-0311]
MALVAQRYGAILSLSLPPAAILNVADVTRQIAEDMIHPSNASAQSYLELGAFFKQQANFQDALSVYKHGLRVVASNDDRRAELEIQTYAMLNLPNRHTLRFRYLLPYDIWSHIFRNLDIKDLLQAACVNVSWRDFMIQWPMFWKLLSDHLPEIKQSAVYSLRRNKPQEFILNGPDITVVCNTVRFLTCSCCRILGKLSFKYMVLTDADTVMLSNVLQSAGSMVQQVEFLDCEIPIRKIVKPILESCSSIPHVSFSRSVVTPKVYNIQKPRWYHFVILCKPFTSLTYLKLCVEKSTFDRDSPYMETDRLSAVLRQCPNLVHLLLDSGGSVYHGQCINQAIRYCPRLKTLAVSDKAEIPTTVTGTNDDKFTAVDSDQHGLSTTQKIQSLILCGGRLKIENDDIAFALKAAHNTLELLYLHYGGGFGEINSILFYHLARLGTPCLREIRLSTESGADACDNQPPMTAALDALFCHCPALEAITIEDTFSTGFNPYYGRLDVDDQVLKSIAKHCSRLRYLKVTGRRCHTNRSILDFAKASGNKLTYLEIDTDRSIILPLVKALVVLETLYIRRDSLVHRDIILDHDKKTVEDILRWRGAAVIWT